MRHSQHDNTTAFNITCRGRSCLKKNRTRAEHSIVPLERAMAELVHARKSIEKTHPKFTTDQYF
jgi:hypothetical protein